MIRLCVLSIALLSIVSCSPGLWADEHLDTLLPPPRWFRDHAEELGITADVRKRIEQTYQAKEPEYHKLKYRVERLAGQLYTALAADDLNEELVADRMKSLLDAEAALKLYQVHVRMSLFAHATSGQRQAARDLANQSPQPNGNWRGGIAGKVSKVRELSKRVAGAGKSITEIEKRMQATDKMFAAGNVSAGVASLDAVIGDLEKTLKE